MHTSNQLTITLYNESLSHDTGAVLGTFAAATCITANVRDRNDFVNPFIGGCLSGSIFGILGRYRVILHSYDRCVLVT